MSVSSLMNNTCTITRNTPTQDAYGSAIASWSTISSGVPCRLQKSKGQWRRNDELGEYLEKQYTVYMKSNAGVLVHDRLIIDSKTYDVTANNMDSAKHHFELQCELIED